jgi:hypothetical protein
MVGDFMWHFGVEDGVASRLYCINYFNRCYYCLISHFVVIYIIILL